MIDWTRPVRQKGSKEVVRVLCTDAPGDMCCVVLPPDGLPYACQSNGRVMYSELISSPLDLENIPEEPRTIYAIFDCHGNVSHASTKRGSENCVKFQEVRE